MEYRKLSHTIYHCEYHLVLPTKYRRNIWNDGLMAHMELKLKEITDHYPHIFIKTVNHDRNHIHLLVSIPPTVSVGKVVGLIKANTARGMKQKFPFLKKVYWGTEGIWSEGYFVSTVGIDEDVIREYINLQGEEDAGQAALLPK